MSSYANTPRPVFRGINDQSLNTPPITRDEFPTNLPHYFVYGERGDTKVIVHNKASAVKALGAKTFDTRSKFYNHQTLFCDGTFKEGGLVALQRVVPDDALPPAGFILWADVLEEDITQYELDPVTKKYVLDSDGNKIPLDPAVVLPGVSIRWVTTPLYRYNSEGTIITQSMIDDFNGGNTSVDIVAVENAIGQVDSMQGLRTGSTLLNIGEFALTEQGAFGNRAGIRLFPVTSSTPFAPRSDYAEDVGSFLFRMQTLLAPTEASLPLVKETVLGSQYSQFSFDPDAVDPITDSELHYSARIQKDWDLAKFTGNEFDEKPLFSNININQTNVDYLCNLIGTLEDASNPDFDFDPDTELHTINFMTGVSYNDVPYITCEFQGSSQGGINLTPINTIMAVGGSDGTMTSEAFDLLVREQCLRYGELENKVLDMGRYPISGPIDTGFAFETKDAIASVVAKRPDFASIFTPWVDGQGILTESEHMEACMILSNMVRGYAESDYYGTPATRYCIVGQQGYLTGHSYTGVVPLSYNVAVTKLGRYMSAGNKIWKEEFAPDVGANKDVKGFSEVNLTYLDKDVKDAYFRLGVMMAEYKDHNTLFHPVVQGAYKEQGSVLNSIITAMACADANRVGRLIWTDLVGNAKLTDAEYIDAVRSGMMEEFRKRKFYDGRFEFEIVPYYTPEDKLNGKSITIAVNMAGNKGKDVFDFTINAIDQSADSE